MKAVVMAGGFGTRFWPLSRASNPKQFLAFTDDSSFLQSTVERVSPLLRQSDVFVACGPNYQKQVLAQLPWLTPDQLILEPLARNTAACVGLAAKYLSSRFGSELMVVLPSDHVIKEEQEFRSVLESALELASRDWLVTFGIQPSAPITGYGYVEMGEVIGTFCGREAFRVKQFIEKPDLLTAEKLVDSGVCLWNSGMFVWKTDVILEEIQRWMPDLDQVLARAESVGFHWEAFAPAFASLASVPVDIGILEQSDRVVTVPCRIGWSDVGGWQALDGLFRRDEHGNISNRKYVQVDGKGCILHSTHDRKIMALLGTEDLVVVDTPDALLVCDRSRTEEIKKIVELLTRQDLEEFL